MPKPTVARLQKQIEELKGTTSNVLLHRVTCHNEAQLAAIIEVYNRYGELVKLEITSEHHTNGNRYHMQLWHLPLLNATYIDEMETEQEDPGRHTPKVLVPGLGYRA